MTISKARQYVIRQRMTPINKYIRLCERLRAQDSRVEVQQRKLNTIEAHLNAQKNKLRVAQKRQRTLLRETYTYHAGFTEEEKAMGMKDYEG